MSTTNTSNSDTPGPRDDPEAVIQEELGEHREALEALADLDIDVLSEDAQIALEILDQSDGDSS